MYTANDIRNIALLGHGGDGKTSLAEALLYMAGATDRLGSVTEGNTVCDFDPEEIKRKISLNTSIIPIEWNGAKINLLDTPGTPDFIGEQLEGASVCGSALIVVSGKSGVSAGTEKAWNIAKTKAKIVFVNKLEDSKADYAKVVEELNSAFGRAIAPFTFPIKEGDKLNFEPLKYVQNLKLSNSLDKLKVLNFKGFNKLTTVELNSMHNIEVLGFKLCFVIKITLKNGKKQEILSGDWLKWTQSPILKYSFYHGELQDYNAIRLVGWNTVGFIEDKWHNLEVVEVPETEYYIQDCPHSLICNYVQIFRTTLAY